MKYEFKNGNIYSNHIGVWVNILDYLQNMVNTVCNKMDNTKFEMSFMGCSISMLDNQLSYPYIRTYNKSEGEDIIKILNDMGIPSELDCYESDDGDDGDGRPIMLQRWSVRMPHIKIPKSECDLPRTILCPGITDWEDLADNNPDDGSWLGR